MIRVIILGSTGSVGSQALNIVRKFKDEFKVVGLACLGSNIELFKKQVEEFKPDKIAIVDKSKTNLFKEKHIEVFSGNEGVEYLCQTGSNVVLNAIGGSIGLSATLSTLESGSYLALANKESLITGGQLVIDSKQFDDQIIPVDSEHSAIYQCLNNSTKKSADVNKLILTCSGGPFLSKTTEFLETVKPSDALKHPNWDMGKVISINSATLVNKALELLEASLLFDINQDKIDITVHKESLVHSMVEFFDGSTLAQISNPNMELPISIGLNMGSRMDREVVKPFNFFQNSTFTFQDVDNEVFPAIDLMRDCINTSPLHPLIYNISNEVFVQEFLNDRLAFEKIVPNIERTIELFEDNFTSPILSPTLDEIFEAEFMGKELANRIIAEK